MEQRLSVITVGIADVARTRAFYEDGLGWRAQFADDEVVFYQLNGLVLSFFLLERSLEEAHLSGAAAQAAGPGAIVLAYNVRERDEVAAVLESAARAGATILRPAEDAFWGGHYAFFADPDGHPWEVAWNPNLLPAADGAVQLGG